MLKIGTAWKVTFPLRGFVIWACRCERNHTMPMFLQHFTHREKIPVGTAADIVVL